MDTLAGKIGVIQNLGIVDRVVRVAIGVLLLGGSALHLSVIDGVVGWHAYAKLISIYPLLTAMLGWDPLYSLFSVRSCNLTGRNQCGTLPYELDAAMGHDPRPQRAYDHSLTGSRH